MKTIRLDYDEYKKMEELIHKQDEIIKEFRSQYDVLVIDDRSQGRFQLNNHTYRVPKLYAKDNEAWIIMEEELDYWKKLIDDRESSMTEYCNRLQLENNQLKDKLKNKWF